MTPSASVAGSVTVKPLGDVVASVPSSSLRTPSRPSTVVRFQVKETRSRQKLVGANIAAAASTSPAVRAVSKSVSHCCTREVGASWAVGGSRVWVTEHS